MIRILKSRDRRHERWLRKRQWKRVWLPFGIVHVEGFGRVLVAFQTLETRWSDKNNRRLWRRVQ